MCSCRYRHSTINNLSKNYNNCKDEVGQLAEIMWKAANSSTVPQPLTFIWRTAWRRLIQCLYNWVKFLTSWGLSTASISLINQVNHQIVKVIIFQSNRVFLNIRKKKKNININILQHTNMTYFQCLEEKEQYQSATSASIFLNYVT